MRTLLLTLWRGWKRGLHGINTGISVSLMTVVYWTALAPVAVFLRLTGAPLLDRGPAPKGGPSAWGPPRSGRQDVRRAQRPY